MNNLRFIPRFKCLLSSGARATAQQIKFVGKKNELLSVIAIALATQSQTD